METAARRVVGVGSKAGALINTTFAQGTVTLTLTGKPGDTETDGAITT